MSTTTADDLWIRLKELNSIGIALSKEQSTTRLLETILVAAKNITNADGGTIYLMHNGARPACRLARRPSPFTIQRAWRGLSPL